MNRRLGYPAPVHVAILGAGATRLVQPEPSWGFAPWLRPAYHNRTVPRGCLRVAHNSPARYDATSTSSFNLAETERYVTTEDMRQNVSAGAYMNALALRRAHSAKDVPRLAVMRSNQGKSGCG